MGGGRRETAGTRRSVKTLGVVSLDKVRGLQTHGWMEEAHRGSGQQGECEQSFGEPEGAWVWASGCTPSPGIKQQQKKTTTRN